MRDPFDTNARLDLDALRTQVPLAVRLLDNVIDASRFPLPQQTDEVHGTRRIELGVTGAVLSGVSEAGGNAKCRTLEREPD